MHDMRDDNVTAREGWMPRIAADAITARERLDAALVAMLDANQVPPCSADPEKWFSTEPATIAWASGECGRCPVLQQCSDYATSDTVTAKYGTWAGVPDPHQRDVLARYESRSP